MSNLTNKNKNKCTVIHRTTSETLRLDDAISNPMRTVMPIMTGPRKKNTVSSPNSSFQITGVTRYDLGEDSADDLDESHTDDISRITDNETPSFSEDSKDTDENQQVFLNIPRPVFHQHPVSIDEEVSTESDSNKIDQQKETLGRFKIIKVENSKPFSRGRWTCFDYADLSENTDSSYILCDNQKVPSDGTPTTTAQILNRNISVETNKTSLNQNNCQENAVDLGTIKMSTKTNIFPMDIDAARIWGNSTSFPLNNSMPPKQTRLDTDVHKNSNKGEDGVDENEGTRMIEKQVVTRDSNDNRGASMTSSATIDTKIEYALDVVKNHLTQAVRLEVEDLKIKINELVDRITYLEYENDVLRANVAPEVLQNLDNTGKM